MKNKVSISEGEKLAKQYKSNWADFFGKPLIIGDSVSPMGSNLKGKIIGESACNFLGVLFENSKNPCTMIGPCLRKIEKESN